MFVQVKKARERVLKEKQSAGDSAWKEWVAKKKDSFPPPVPANKSDGEKKKAMSLLTEEER